MAIPVFFPLNSVTSTSNPNVFVLGCANGTLRVFDLRDKKLGPKSDAHDKKKVTSIVFSPKSNSVFSLGRNHSFEESALPDLSLVKKYLHPESLSVEDDFVRIGIHPETYLMCVGSNDGKIAVFFS